MSAIKFGRVDEENNVFVLELGSERKVGQYPNVKPEDALAFFENKFADLDANYAQEHEMMSSDSPNPGSITISSKINTWNNDDDDNSGPAPF